MLSSTSPPNPSAAARSWWHSLPLVTTSVLLLCVVLFIASALHVAPSDGTVCLSPVAVVAGFPLAIFRIFTSPFFHVDFFHILFNMLTFVPMGVQMEKASGSLSFFCLIAFFLLSAGIVDVVISTALASAGVQLFFYTCSIGFSGVIFALIVVRAQTSQHSHEVLCGIAPIPTRVYPWVLLFVIQLGFGGRVSFLGHLSGMLAGYLYAIGRLTPLQMSNDRMTRWENALPSGLRRAPSYVPLTGMSAISPGLPETATHPTGQPLLYTPSSSNTTMATASSSASSSKGPFSGHGHVLGTGGPGVTPI